MTKLGLNAARDASHKKVVDIEFEPKGNTDLDKPKFGKDDPDNQPHEGGNTWAGGVSSLFLNSNLLNSVLQTGGRDTAGMGGRGGYMRLYKGHPIKQVEHWPNGFSQFNILIRFLMPSRRMSQNTFKNKHGKWQNKSLRVDLKS